MALTPSNPLQAVSLRFPGWELRPLERQLLVRGEVVPVGGRAFDVLLALVERQGQLVTKSQLLDAAWPGLVVEENNVSVQIAALRKLLGTQAIATVAGIGYRLAVAAEGPATAPPATTGQRPDPAAPARGAAQVDLVGRDADLQALGDLVGDRPLVSLIGTGGVGKSSLARAVLARRSALAGDDVQWIDLAPLREAAQIVPLVAKALAIDLGGSASAQQDLIAALSQVRALVALDNCEHLLADVAAFIRLAREAAPDIRWLVTSRMPLHLSDEVVYRLGPLDVPPAGASLAEARTRGALALLVRRALAADRHFVLDEASLPVAIDLCRQLDGLPLAIEMAAARLATLGLQGVHQQLHHRLRLLTGPRDGPARHHTLLSTFDWSHELLSAPERRVFRRLEPFLGGFCAAMAQQVACDLDDGPGALDEWQALEALSALVDKSLVHRVADEPGRYFLFESARDYAGRRLAEAGEEAALRRRHAEVVAGWFAAAASDLARLGDETWAARYLPERHNVRAALHWACAAQESDILAGLVAALVQIDSIAQLQHEIVQYDIPLDVVERAAPPLRAAACLELSWAHYEDGSRELGTALAQRALQDYQALGDLAGSYRALAQLVRLYESRPGLAEQAEQLRQRLRAIDDHQVPLRTRLSCTILHSWFAGPRTVARLQELQGLAQRSGHQVLAAVCRVHITDALLMEGRFAEAAETARRFLQAGEERPRVRGLILNNLALALVQLGQVDEAQGAVRAAFRALPSSAHNLIDILALAAARDGRLDEAALMAGHAARVRRDRDESPDPAEAAAIAETEARLREALPPRRLDELLAAGSALGTPDLLDLALPA